MQLAETVVDVAMSHSLIKVSVEVHIWFKKLNNYIFRCKDTQNSWAYPSARFAKYH